MNINLDDTKLAEAVQKVLSSASHGFTSNPLVGILADAVKANASHIGLRVEQQVREWVDSPEFARQMRAAFRSATIAEAERLARQAARAAVMAREGDTNG